MYKLGKEYFDIMSHNTHAYETEGKEGYKIGSDHRGKGVRDVKIRP